MKHGKYKKENLFNYHIGSLFFSVPISELLYLTTAAAGAGRVMLRTLKREAEFLGNLSEISKNYPVLYRSDKSYLVNLDLLDHFDNQTREIHFIDGSIAYASYRKARELTKMLK